MLRLIVSGQEFYDEINEEFVTFDDVVLELEHSLASLSKWESKFGKPFLSSSDKTDEEVIAYIEFMVLSDNLSKEVYDRISKQNLDEINDYISSEQSATTFSDTSQQRGKGREEIVTSELIYYWMLSYNVPFECENWHLNRLFALLRICNIKNSKQRKMSRSEIAARNRDLNAQRKASLGTSG